MDQPDWLNIMCDQPALCFIEEKSEKPCGSSDSSGSEEEFCVESDSEEADSIGTYVCKNYYCGRFLSP